MTLIGFKTLSIRSAHLPWKRCSFLRRIVAFCLPLKIFKNFDVKKSCKFVQKNRILAEFGPNLGHWRQNFRILSENKPKIFRLGQQCECSVWMNIHILIDLWKINFRGINCKIIFRWACPRERKVQGNFRRIGPDLRRNVWILKSQKNYLLVGEFCGQILYFIFWNKIW